MCSLNCLVWFLLPDARCGCFRVQSLRAALAVSPTWALPVSETGNRIRLWGAIILTRTQNIHLHLLIISHLLHRAFQPYVLFHQSFIITPFKNGKCITEESRHFSILNSKEIRLLLMYSLRLSNFCCQCFAFEKETIYCDELTENSSQKLWTSNDVRRRCSEIFSSPSERRTTPPWFLSATH